MDFAEPIVGPDLKKRFLSKKRQSTIRDDIKNVKNRI